MRILVCGGRDFADRPMLEAALDRLHAAKTVTAVIHGAARGADSLGAQWARAQGVAVEAFPADWTKHGMRAGFIRNRRMLEKGQPELVVVFPGGSGTADMVRHSRQSGVPVWQPAPAETRPAQAGEAASAAARRTSGPQP